MTKLAPPRFVGQVMGLWFLALALGNNLAGQLSGEYDARDLHSLPALFLKIACGSLDRSGRHAAADAGAWKAAHGRGEE